eukprot:CAMPEP_0113846716 /NCGR_PEP_ID=MMETSP0372-20130328/1463_1 /TAXON_ID=340204 /ORGANISM="Lankesteria abbotti" /LENGTH=269 /DNA_ID=CAMNT_0000815893 /DNA_START=136 /DNA_END=945 /DNA_ORIENTATION=+ /assembly_acc=CAM_ASM_000359
MCSVEEQELEIEALESLFDASELTVTRRPDADNFGQISLRLMPHHADTNQVNHVAVTLVVKYKEHYPEVTPDWQLDAIVGMDECRMKALRSAVQSEVDSSSGMPIVYCIAEVTQNWLRSNNFPVMSMHEEMLQARAGISPTGEVDDTVAGVVSDVSSDSNDDEDVDVPDGRLADKELVGVEDRMSDAEFLLWAAEHRLMMIRTGVWKGSTTEVKSSKLTGKQLFEGDAVVLEEEDYAEEGDNTPNDDVCWSNADLFAGGDVNLDDVDDF